MSFFAGALLLDARRSVTDDLADAFGRVLSRHAADRPTILRGSRYCLAQVVLPTEPAVHHIVDDAGNLTVLAGDPLFASGARSAIDTLHESRLTGDETQLRGARGSYCAVHWNGRAQRLELIADKLALRPIYYGIENGCVYFSTALRVFESLRILTGRMNIRGVAELAALGYPLGPRSPYEAISSIESGTIIAIDVDGINAHRYWHWDRLPAANIPAKDLPRAIYHAFLAAIERRLDGDRSAVAGLSGGLDSRCVVAGLMTAGARVATFNFAPLGSEDLELGRMAAAALGTRHFELASGPLDFWDRMQAAHQAWLAATPLSERPRHTHRLWSGDGGSCTLGHIYITDTIVELMRQGRTEEAIDAYMKHNRIGLIRKLFARAERDRIVSYPRQGIRAELERLEKADAARRIHLYLLLNGQRRLHAKHYENLDLRRFELITPFFDSDLLQLIIASRIEAFLHHRFYNRWLQEFQPAVSAVPWQAYPGHEPCPLPKPAGLRNQWDSWHDEQASAELVQREIALADETLRSAQLPRQLFNRHVLWLARWLTRLNLGDYTHVMRCAATFARYNVANAEPTDRRRLA